MADNCVCAQPGEYHLRSDHRHNGDDCLVAYDERCPCKKFRLGGRVDVAAENARLQEQVDVLELEMEEHNQHAQDYKALAERRKKAMDKARVSIRMIDASPYGSLNAQLKAEALAAIEEGKA